MTTHHLKGTIQHICDTQTFSSGFKKRDFIVTEDDTKYPNPVKFTLKKDNCDLLDDFKEGDSVTVSFVINGRDWTNPKTQNLQWFVDLDALKITGSNAQEKGRGKKGNATPPPADPTAVELSTNDLDDMPF